METIPVVHTLIKPLLEKGAPDLAQLQKDASLRALFMRIKNARIPRDLRDFYSKLVRSMAAEDKADRKFIKGILDIIFLLEMTRTENPGQKEKGLPGAEKTADEEMKLLSSERAARAKEKQRLEALQGKISTLA